MGKIGIRIERCILLCSLVVLLIYSYKKIINDSIKMIGVSRIVNAYVDPYYEELTDNSGLTNINGISNVFINMDNDGYDIYKSDITQTYIDISFTKEGSDSYRYYYDMNTGRITFLSSSYETSSSGLSYIIEEKKR